MSIGERIRFIRNKRGMTQKYLGTVVGFPEKTADVRMAQYESGSRTPKEELLKKLAEVFDISTEALTAPRLDDYIGVMHTFFALEDLYNLRIDMVDGEPCIRLSEGMDMIYIALQRYMGEWHTWSERLKKGEITREEYDHWRYNYPDYDPYAEYSPLKQFADAAKKKYAKKAKK